MSPSFRNLKRHRASFFSAKQDSNWETRACELSQNRFGLKLGSHFLGLMTNNELEIAQTGQMNSYCYSSLGLYWRQLPTERHRIRVEFQERDLKVK